MENFIKLNLHNQLEKAEAQNLPRREVNESAEREKALKRVAKIAAHRAAKEFARGRFGIFSK